MAAAHTYTCSDYKHFKERLLATGSELHKVTILLLGRLSVEHGDSTSKKPNLALPEVLNNAPVALQKMKSLDYEGNILKIYDISGAIKLSIDLTEIDIPLAIDFLRKINGLLPQLQRKCTYKPRNHLRCCIKEHHSPTSYTVNAIGLCIHCGIDEAICRLDYSLEMDRKLRNIGGHLVETIGVKFLNGRHIFPELPNCANVDQLFNLIEATMDGLLHFMTQVKYFPILKALDLEIALEHKVLLKKIFKSNQNELEQYFLGDILKSQNFHKEHSTRKLRLQILIKRTDLPWYSIHSWFPNLSSMFEAKDITIKGPLMKVFRNSIVDVFENKMNLKYKKDYDITDIHCDFHRYSKNVANSSSFDFHICVSERPTKPFPAYLSDGMSEETEDLVNQLEKNISDGVFNEYNMTVEVGFNRWGVGSIKIGGYISVSNGKFTQEIKQGILNIIKHQTEIHFDTPFVVINELINYELDETKLELSFLLTSTNENYYSKTEKNEKLIKEWFLDNVNEELVKDRKEKDTDQNKDPGNDLSEEDITRDWSFEEVMSTGEELYDIIVAANVELQNILSLLLNIYADVRALSNPPVHGQNNLCSLLSTDIDLLRDVVKGYVSGKLYTSEDKNTVLPNVDSKAFDSSLLLDLLIKFVVTEYIYGKCRDCHGGGCCRNCNHSLHCCNKCLGRNPSEKCWHKCNDRLCKTPAKECSKTICCTTCNTCLTCNKRKFDNEVTSILNGRLLNSLTCPWYKFTHSLDLSKDFRNLFGHVTVEECREFISNGTCLEKFKLCTNLEQLQKCITFIFSNIVTHAQKELATPPTTLIEVNKTMGNVACIFKHGEPLKKYINDRCSKIKEIFINDVRFYDRLEKVSRLENTIKESESNIINFMKEHFREMHIMQIPIQRYQGELDLTLLSKSQCKDFDLASNIFNNALIKAFDKNLKLRYQIDYKFKLESLTVKNDAKNSHLEFKMTVYQDNEDPFPEHLTNANHPETLNYQEYFKRRIEKSISDIVNEDGNEIKDIEINFQCCSEVVIVKGAISDINGKFTKEQENVILNAIRTEGKVSFKSDRVYIKQLVNPSIDLVVNVKASVDVIKRVKESEEGIKESCTGDLWVF